MKLSDLGELFSIRDLRNAAFGLIVVLGGLGLAIITYAAHSAGETRFAAIAAGASLVFVLLILIFVVPPLARNASKEASQLNLPFDVTLGGAVMFGLIAIVGFSAFNTGNNLLFLVLSFLLAGVVVGFFAGLTCLRKLDVKMRFPETIFAGEETGIIVSIHNRKRVFGSYSVVAEVRGTERSESIAAADLRRLLPRTIANRLAKAPVVRRTLDHFAFLPRGEVVENRVPHVFPNRGRFLIKDFELTTKFPFAFFRHRRRLSARETELVVLPKVDPLPSEIDDMPLETGELPSQTRGTGQDLLALRDYRPLDDLRRVDWKATARSTGLIVREFASDDDRKVTVVLDPRVPPEEGTPLSIRDKIEAEKAGAAGLASPRFEDSVGRTASLLSHFAEQQAEIRLMIGVEIGEFGVGSRHLVECLRRLAVAEPLFEPSITIEPLEQPLYALMEADDVSHYFVLTTLVEDQFSPEVAARARVLKY